MFTPLRENDTNRISTEFVADSLNSTINLNVNLPVARVSKYEKVKRNSVRKLRLEDYKYISSGAVPSCRVLCNVDNNNTN